jgi:hypothetical protein
MSPALTQDIRCSECNEKITISTARLAEDAEYAIDASAVRYLCPVCHIQAKNRRMLKQMVEAFTVRT